MTEDRRREFPDLPRAPVDLEHIRLCLALAPAQRIENLVRFIGFLARADQLALARAREPTQ